ncbi:MAG: hypothetical protein EOM25_07605, partial [Deltaproteobacteria bacterium]|nr:hypothetical protein [Deltaproteobacteria bacterium]
MPKPTRLLFLVLAACLASCGGKDIPPFTPPESLALAPIQRQEFVVAFLRGDWCDARHLFESSQQNYLAQDDLCAMAHNCELAFRVTSWAGVPAEELLPEAARFRDLDPGCATLGIPEPDQVWDSVLESGDWDALNSLIQKTNNPLFASVYARKATERALHENDMSLALKFLTQAMNVDREQAWVVFLVQDWMFVSQMEQDPEASARARA